MTKTGTAILAFFGAVWGTIAVVTGRAPLWTIAVVLVCGAAVAYAAHRAGFSPVRTEPQEKRVGIVVGIASAVEGVAILIAINVVVWAGRPDLIVPAIAAVVALHFLPIAYVMPAPRLYWCTAAMLAAATAGAVAPDRVPAAVVAASCAILLWLTAASSIVDARVRVTSPPA